MEQPFIKQPALAERSSAPSLHLYSVLDSIRTLRRELGLTTNDLATLQGLISFLPRTTSPENALMIVFPSNAALSSRANGLDERTIRRSLARLAAAGLISRKDSATRKRFPLRYGGVIKDAFGFDLQPLIERKTELAAKVADLERHREEVRSLRAKALALRVEACRILRDDETQTFLEEVRNVLRRATLKIHDIVAIIRKLADLVGSDQEVFPAGNDAQQKEPADNLPACDGQIVRHVESNTLNRKSYREKRVTPGESVSAALPDAKTLTWGDLKKVSAYFPTEPKDTYAVKRIVTDLAQMLRIGVHTIMDHLRSAGPGKLFVALDYILGQTERGTVHRPEQYLARMMA